MPIDSTTRGNAGPRPDGTPSDHPASDASGMRSSSDTSATSSAPLRLELAGIAKEFDGAPVLSGIDFDDEVTTLAIIGPSGGGKSTLLRIIDGLAAPTSGTVRLDGIAVDYDEKVLPAYRVKLGFVFQQGGLFDHMSALDNIAVPLMDVHGYAQREAEQRANELMERLGLAAEARKKPRQLSGGQQQRIAIARAMAAHPRLLLLDEPTSALDPEYTTEVLDLVKELRDEGARFIIVTHEMGFARNACDRVAFLSEGHLMEYGESDEVFAHPETPQLKRFLGKLLEWSL